MPIDVSVEMGFAVQMTIYTVGLALGLGRLQRAVALLHGERTFSSRLTLERRENASTQVMTSMELYSSGVDVETDVESQMSRPAITKLSGW